MKLGKVEPVSKLPPKVVVVPPYAFSDTWEARPRKDVAIGLRRLSLADEDSARGEAERYATGFYAQFEEAIRAPDPEVLDEARNDMLFASAIGMATTNPNDVTKPYFIGGGEMAAAALTSAGLRRLFDELTLLHLEGGVSRGRASDADAQRLGRALARGKKLTEENRMVIAYLIDELKVGDEAPLEDEEDGDEDEAVFRVRSA